METMKANRAVVAVTGLLIVLLIVVLGTRVKNLFSNDNENLPEDNEQQVVVSTPVSYIAPEKSEAEKFVESMTIEEKVGQLFSFGFAGYSLSSEELNFLQTYKPGGIVFQGDNISDEQQVVSLAREIQATNPKLKLFTMVDQEGGVVRRVFWDEGPSAKSLAYYDSLARCDAFKTRNGLLNNLGLNFNLGIIADVTDNTFSFIFDRVFSSDYNQVSNIISESINCFGEVINAVKHYPGHGGTELDTHLTLATISKTKEEWEGSDLVPFKTAVDSNHKAIMIGHLILNWLDSQNPASLSKLNIDYLRDTLGYKGLIITDDMRMLDSSGFDRKDALKRAILSGNNILLYSVIDINEKKELMDYAILEIKNGLISESELNVRVEKAIEMKLIDVGR